MARNVRIMAVLLVLALPLVAAAQTETGRITGLVTDATGGVLPGATVTIKSTGTGAVRTTVTDTGGRYVIANVAPGPFELTVELSGFNKFVTQVVVSVGQAVMLDAKLQIAGQTETVTVTAETPTINTSNAEVAVTMSEKMLRELPTLTRNVYDLVGVAGNVVADSMDSGRGTGYAINGQRSSSTNVLLDGSANNNEFSASIGQDVPLDSVQEFAVITSNFSAQYGRASGGVVNVLTKSGTNQFRGTGYDFFRNDALTSNTPDNIANDIAKGKYTRHQMGYSIGGPIVKDKLHFFSSLEYIRVRSNDTEISWVPTQDFINASAAPTRAFFNTYGLGANINGPILTRGEVSAILGSGAGAFNSLPANLPVFGQVKKPLATDAGGGLPQDNYQLVNRVDWSMGSNTQFYVRWAYQSVVAEPGTNASSPYDGYDTGFVNKNHNVLGSLTRVFGSNFTMQSKAVWNRLYSDQPLNGPAQPTLYMNNSGAVRLQGYRIAFPGYLPWSPGSAIPFGGPQQLIQLYQDQTWVKGKHDFRFGGSYVHIADDRTFGAYENAVEALNVTSAAIPSLNNFVLGQLARFQVAINPEGYPGGTYVTPVGFPSFTSKNKYNEFALYVNDNWSIARRVTLNLGLRYEYYGPQQKSDPKYDSNFYYADPNVSVSTSSTTEIIDAVRGGTVYPSNESPIKGLWKSDWNNFAPRVGFAWDVRGDGKTSIRGGYGVAYERNFGNVTYNVLFNPPKYLVASIDAPSDIPTQPIYSDNQGPFGGVAGITKTIPAGSLRHVDQNIKTAYAHFYSASFQHQLAPALSGSVEYTGSSGRKLYDLADVNKRGAPLVYEGVGTPTSRPNTSYAAFNSRGNRGKSQYHALTVGLDARQVGKTGLGGTVRYTYAHTKDNLSSTFSDYSGAYGGSGSFNLGYLDAFDPMLDYAYSENDVRHRLVASAIWNLPFARNSTGATKALLGDWQVNIIFAARTGYPFTLFDGTNGLALSMRAEDPIGLSRNATSGTPTGNPNEYMLLDLTPILPYAGGYVNPLTGNSDFGPYPADMTVRNAFRGPGFWNVDLSFAKRIRFGPRYAVQFRFETYDLFNHANLFANVNSADISSYTEITGKRDGNRRMQIGLKFEF